MTLRINSGWCRGLTLKSPTGLHTRPTASRVREAVWNSLLPYIQNADILDIFSGSGAFGIEGLSRGAQSVIFIDYDQKASSAIMSNIKAVQERAAKQERTISLKFMRREASAALASLESGSQFDIVWLDPPYSYVNDFIKENLGKLKKMLKKQGVIAMESSVDSQEPIRDIAQMQSLELLKQKKYGSTLITFMSKEARYEES